MGSKLLDNVKQDIRSILLTAPKGMQLQKLCHEYRDLIGQNIPVRELGYNSPEDFLKSIPDVLTINWYSQLNSYVLKAVADETTRHIEKLVSKQKVSKKNTLTSSKKRSHSADVSKFYPTTRAASRLSCKPVAPRFGNANTAIPARSSQNAVVPATVKLDVQTMLEEYQDGISIQNFGLAFQKRYGKEIKFSTFGFSSLQECLEAIPGLEFRNVRGQVQVRLKPKVLSKPVLVSNNFTSKVVKGVAQAPSIEKLKDNFTSKIVKGVAQAPSIEKLKGRITPPLYSGEIVPPVAPTCDIPPPTLQKEPLFPESSVTEISKSGSPYNNFVVYDQFDSSGVSDVMKKNFKKILKNNPDGVWAAEFPAYYRSLTGTELDLKEIGYVSLIEMVNSLPDVFRKARPPGCKSDWQLFDSSVPELLYSPNSRFHGLDTAATSRYVSEVIANVRKILLAYPEGVYLDDFIHLYSLNCDSEFNLQRLQCSTIENFLLSVAESVPLKFNYSNARTKVLYGYFAEPMVVPAPTPAPLPAKIPDDAVLPGCTFMWQKPPDKFEGYFPIRVGTVLDPGLMWIQLEGEETTDALELLMNDLDEFYTSASGESYVMREHHIVIGAACAGVWAGDGSWHRVSIIGVGNTGADVNVLFVDYGTRDKVKRTQLRYLRQCFMKLPAQAIKSRMAFVKPLNGVSWEPKVRDRLLGCCRNKVLLAERVNVPSIDRIAIWICDTSKEEEVHYNKLLIDENLAVYCSEEPASKENTGAASVITNGLRAPPGNFPNPVSSADFSTVNQADLINAISVLMHAMSSTSVALNEGFVEYILRSLNICAKDGSPVNAAILYHLIASGMDLPSIIRVLGLSPNTPISTSTQSSRIVTPDAPSSSSWGQFFQPVNGFHDPNTNHNSVSTIGKTACIAAPSQTVTTVNKNAPVPVEVNHRGRSISCTSSDDSDSAEVFEDDDDEFEQICKKYSPKASKEVPERCVRRVNLNNGYKFHIVKVNNLPYVSSGDISKLLWSNESSDYLYQRLRGKGIILPSKVITNRDEPGIFDQLQNYKVKGVKGGAEKSVNLYSLDTVIDILNKFGHPSPTIRAEIKHEMQTFNPLDALWKSFSALDTNEDDSDGNEYTPETDTGKFNRLCVFDLKSALEAFRFKKLQIMNKISISANNTDLYEQLQKIDSQYKKYEKRIEEIETTICCD